MENTASNVFDIYITRENDSVTTESYLWGKLKKWPKADLERHEDKLRFGIPDVSFGFKTSKRKIGGWIEQKAFKAWPKKGGVVKFHNFKSTQKRWLTRRGKTGGYCYVMAVIGRGDLAQYLLWHWSDMDQLGELPRADLEDLAIYHTRGAIDFPLLARTIRLNP